MFGAFGLLGLIYLALRYMAGDRFTWSDTPGVWAFWLYHLGLVMWIAMNFLPVGFPQLEAVYEHGYAYALRPGVLQPDHAVAMAARARRRGLRLRRVDYGLRLPDQTGPVLSSPA